MKLWVAFRDHRKVVMLSDKAFRVCVETMLVVAERETQGEVFGRFDPAVVKELVEAGVWDRLDDGKLVIHDWPDWQTDPEVLHDKRSVAGKKGAHVRWYGDGKPMAPAMAKGRQPHGKGNGKPMADVDVKTTNTTTSEVAGAMASATPEWHPDSLPLAELLRDFGNDPDEGFKVPDSLAGWTRIAHLILDKDKRDRDEAFDLMRWCHKPGTMFVVQSMESFRSKYDSIRANRRREEREAPPPPDLRKMDW